MTCHLCGKCWERRDEPGVEVCHFCGETRTEHERDSLATQLDDAKQVIVTLRATMEQVRRERDEARAKLARVRDVVARDYHETAAWAVRIIDEKEGGQ